MFIWITQQEVKSNIRHVTGEESDGWRLKLEGRYLTLLSSMIGTSEILGFALKHSRDFAIHNDDKRNFARPVTVNLTPQMI